MLKNTLNSISDGFKVLASEAKWVFIKSFRLWEIKQMKKRLAEEYQTLGTSFANCHITNTAFDPNTSDNDLTLKQIAFLLEEIKHLEEELATTRSEYVKCRTVKPEA